ncbi:MAG: conjugal transfer protein TraF [Candidatus Bathyarchaeota archaeon]|nr:MAG: conjugal transfer protein TraF [Candidatus Bathyarchaeota archaeon]
MNQVVEIPAESFNIEVERADKPVVIEFWIRSCSFCQKFKPIFEKLPKIFANKVKFIKMNMFQSLENLKLAEDLGVEDTPTLKLFCYGKEVGEVIGFRSLDTVVKEIKAIFQHEECHNMR